jgi:hypothetical protein
LFYLRRSSIGKLTSSVPWLVPRLDWDRLSQSIPSGVSCVLGENYSLFMRSCWMLQTTGFHICKQKTIDNCTWNLSLKFIEVRIFCYLMPVMHFFNSCFEGTIRGHTFYFDRNCVRWGYYLLFWMNCVADLLWRSFYLRRSSIGKLNYSCLGRKLFIIHAQLLNVADDGFSYL